MTRLEEKQVGETTVTNSRRNVNLDCELLSQSINNADVPQGRKGKDREIVSTILNDLDQLKDGAALKIPLAELTETREKVRSALNLANRKAGLNVATATDANFFYIWNVKKRREEQGVDATARFQPSG
jgi:hypothetical protein